MGRRARRTCHFQSCCRAIDKSVRCWSGSRGTAARIVYLTGSRKRIPSTTRVNRALVTPWVTLGGASVDEFGTWAPLMHEQVHFAGNEILVDVPAASAALVFLTE